MATHCHNTPALPNQTRRAAGVLPSERWNELHDYLTLALDALGDQPEDFSVDFHANAALHMKLALRLIARRYEWSISANGRSTRRRKH